MKYHNITFYFPRRFTDLEELYSAPQLNPNLCESLEAKLVVDLQNKLAKEGSFKMPFTGHVSTPHGIGNNRVGPFESNKPICAKWFFLCTQSGKIIYRTGVAGSVNVFKEMNVFEWAVTLFSDSYKYINNFNSEHGMPPFDIPQMRFVCSSAAITTVAHGSHAFFVEELINAEEDGPFLKYINNASGEFLMAASNTDKHYHIAEFLAFVQHQQYQQSDQQVFISNLQGIHTCSFFSNYIFIFLAGGKTLLTDPQIMTHLSVETISNLQFLH